MQGWLQNVNTLEEFKALDKARILQDLSQEVTALFHVQVASAAC